MTLVLPSFLNRTVSLPLKVQTWRLLPSVCMIRPVGRRVGQTDAHLRRASGK